MKTYDLNANPQNLHPFRLVVNNDQGESIYETVILARTLAHARHVAPNVASAFARRTKIVGGENLDFVLDGQLVTVLARRVASPRKAIVFGRSVDAALAAMPAGVSLGFRPDFDAKHRTPKSVPTFLVDLDPAYA